mmetsp:Transcript_1387/g.4501  ORF Transcript_1387/g.4501 Transcript_1387/m.4501 type:complete len:265 (+) Transcript_1387:508-1302(+)
MERHPVPLEDAVAIDPIADEVFGKLVVRTVRRPLRVPRPHVIKALAPALCLIHVCLHEYVLVETVLRELLGLALRGRVIATAHIANAQAEAPLVIGRRGHFDLHHLALNVRREHAGLIVHASRLVGSWLFLRHWVSRQAVGTAVLVDPIRREILTRDCRTTGRISSERQCAVVRASERVEAVYLACSRTYHSHRRLKGSAGNPDQEARPARFEIAAWRDIRGLARSMQAQRGTGREAVRSNTSLRCRMMNLDGTNEFGKNNEIG